VGKRQDKIVKRTVEFIAICYLTYLIICIGVINTSLSLDVTGVLEKPASKNILGIHTMIEDFGNPTETDIEFFEIAFGGQYAGKTVMVNFTFENCILNGVYVYWRILSRRSLNESVPEFGAFVYGDVASLEKFGKNTTVTFQIDERATSINPFVMIIVITPMGWNGSGLTPIYSGMATIRVI
jgi:hypothetical protein